MATDAERLADIVDEMGGLGHYVNVEDERCPPKPIAENLATAEKWMRERMWHQDVLWSELHGHMVWWGGPGVSAYSGYHPDEQTSRVKALLEAYKTLKKGASNE